MEVEIKWHPPTPEEEETVRVQMWGDNGVSNVLFIKRRDLYGKTLRVEFGKEDTPDAD